MAFPNIKIFLVILFLNGTLNSRADLVLHSVVKSYKVVLSTNNIYSNQNKFGLISQKKDSSEFDIAQFMLGFNICNACYRMIEPTPKHLDYKLRVKELKDDLGKDSIYYYLEVILAKDYQSNPYYGIAMIKRINPEDTNDLYYLNRKFNSTNWQTVSKTSQSNLDSLSNRPKLDSLLKKHARYQEVASPLKFTTGNTKFNIMFRGVWSPIDVAVSDVPTENTFIKVSNATVRGKWGKFQVWPDSGSNKTTKIHVYTNVKNDTVLVGKHEYRIKNIPKPTAFYMGAKDSMTFKISKIRAGRFVSAKLEDFLYDVRFRVQQFDCTIYHAGEKNTYSNPGTRISQEVQNQIKTLTSGDQLIFHNIVATNQIKQVYHLEPIVVTVE